MGLGTLKTFKRMHRALDARVYSLAASELLDSKYAVQVGQRAIDNADKLRGQTNEK